MNINTQIGTLGMTGNALRPHLHFEIHYPIEHKFNYSKCKPKHQNVAAINPYPSLFGAKNRIKTEADLAEEKRRVTLVTVENTIKKLFDIIKSHTI